MILNIYFSIVILSRVYNITHQLNDLLPVGLLAQLVVHCTGGAKVSRITLGLQQLKLSSAVGPEGLVS